MLIVGQLTIDHAGRVVRWRGEQLMLRAKEFDLLEAFAANAGRVLTRRQILLDVWGYDEPGKTRTVDVHVNHLRRRLAGTGVVIETQRGVGYRLLALPPPGSALQPAGDAHRPLAPPAAPGRQGRTQPAAPPAP